MNCECKTWATDRMDLMAFGNGHHHNCDKYVAGPARKVFMVDDGAYYWIVASTREEAMGFYAKDLKQAGLTVEEQEPELTELDDADTFFIDNDGTKTVKTCGEWAMESKPGILGCSEW